MSRGKTDKHSLSDVAQRELILTRYAQRGSFQAVAKEFGTHAMTVKRMWDKLPEEERDRFRAAAENIQEEIRQVITLSDTECAADQIRLINEAYVRASQELNNRLSTEKVKFMSDKDLIGAVRMLHAIRTGARPGDDPEEHIRLDIYNIMDASASDHIIKLNNPNGYGDK